jgi:hypothetical protein
MKLFLEHIRMVSLLKPVKTVLILNQVSINISWLMVKAVLVEMVEQVVSLIARVVVVPASILTVVNILANTVADNGDGEETLTSMAQLVALVKEIKMLCAADMAAAEAALLVAAAAADIPAVAVEPGLGILRLTGDTAAVAAALIIQELTKTISLVLTPVTVL